VSAKSLENLIPLLEWFRVIQPRHSKLFQTMHTDQLYGGKKIMLAFFEGIYRNRQQKGLVLCIYWCLIFKNVLKNYSNLFTPIHYSRRDT
jgi:hypothetical protein